MKVRAADVVDAEVLVTDRRVALEHARGKIESYLLLEERMLKGRSHAAYVESARRVGPYLTLRRGIRHEQVNIDWLVDTIDVIAFRARRFVDKEVLV